MSEKPRVLILYGSQKGNAKSIAETIGESAPKFGFKGEVRAGNDFAKKLDAFAKERLVIMVVSTTGAGEHPDNCGRFFRKLNKKTVAKDLLDSLKFTVLAIGDTNYDHFCRAGKRFDTLFHRLGGERIYPLGCADDATGLEAVIDPWINGLWPALRVATSVSVEVRSPLLEGRSGSFSSEVEADDVKQCEDLLEAKEDTTCRLVQFHEMFPDINLEEELRKMKKKPRLRKCAVKLKYLASSSFTLDEEEQETKKNIIEGQIMSARYLSTFENEEDRRVIHMEVEKSQNEENEEAWETGDAFGIFCENKTCLVNGVVRRLKLSSKDQVDKPCRVVRGPSHLSALNRTSLRSMLTSRVDLSLDIPPRKTFLRQLAEYCDDTKDRDALISLCDTSSTESKKRFHDLIEMQRPNLPELLNMFPSCSPPPEVVLNAMPPLVPRYYSASSSPLVSKTRISFAFSVLEYSVGEGKTRRKRCGTCTSWLESSCSSILSNEKKKKEKCPVRIRMMRRLQSSTFRPPADTTKPLILIGPGTGVAPFIGFLQHRRARQEMSKKVEEDTCSGCWRGGFEIEEEDCKSPTGLSQQFGEIHLFFGCRHEKKDFLYREEMNRYLDSGVLTKLYTAFSRDQKEKIYVTHRIREHGKKLARMILSEDACIYVCGDGAKMAKDVQSAVSDVLLRHSSEDEIKDTDQALSYIDGMIRRGRYLTDVW